jgi:uncharacterized protein with von Willebrand factor type A (vWA) domain
VALLDMDALGRYLEDGERDELDLLRRQLREAIERLAAEQGLEKTKRGFELTPQALRLFQGRLLERIFADLDPSRTGRHQGDVQGDGAVETVPTRPYEFGDSVAHMDIPGSIVNAILRQAGAAGWAAGDRVRLEQRDIEVHRTRNTPKCATTVVLDMSGSMRYGGLHVSVKRMALALQGSRSSIRWCGCGPTWPTRRSRRPTSRRTSRTSSTRCPCRGSIWPARTPPIAR